jgi:hypothetical protein
VLEHLGGNRGLTPSILVEGFEGVRAQFPVGALRCSNISAETGV